MMRSILLAAAAGLGVLVIIALLAAPVGRVSYEDLAAAALARRGVEHSGVTVVDGCAPTVQLCRRYHGDVTVRLPAPQSGSIDCRWRWTGCALTVRALGIHAEPLPDQGLPLGREDMAQIIGEAAGRLAR